jgi:FtsZ-binding cell division protein ZapB
MEKLYEYSEGSGCNPALFDGLGHEGATVTAHDIGWLMGEVERLDKENDQLDDTNSTLDDENDRMDEENKQLKEENERLRKENERLHELMTNVYKEQLRSPSSYVLARVEEIANEYKREFKQ